MRHLDLFSGIGGFALAASWVWGEDHEIVSFCEIEDYPQRVLKKHWPDVPCHGDIKTLKGDSFGAIDLITGGFPCQPFSVAGKQGGSEDDRHLWPEMFRVIQEAKPTWIIGENVTGLDGLGLDQTIFDLEGIGYEVAPPLEIPACAVGAGHIRNRIWIIANRPGVHVQGFAHRQREIKLRGSAWRLPESGVDRVVHGLPSELDKDRLKGLGNAIVPQCVVPIMQSIKEISCQK